MTIEFLITSLIVIVSPGTGVLYTLAAGLSRGSRASVVAAFGCTLGTSFFMQIDDRAAADKFVADEPLNQAGVYRHIHIHRWSNSFGKRAADYRRKGMQQFLCTGPKTGTAEFFREHLHAHESYFASYGDSFIFRGPIRSADGADNIGTALLLELPDRAAADKFWNEEPFAKNGGYQKDARITRWVFGH